MPDYYDIVKKPIDLATMEGRCVSDLYTTPQKFVDDFALMMNNAVQYNTVRLTFYVQWYLLMGIRKCLIAGITGIQVIMCNMYCVEMDFFKLKYITNRYVFKQTSDYFILNHTILISL